MKVALVSLGCPKNRIDSEYVLGALGQAGWTITDDPGEADVTIVNTCGFIGPAKEESIRAILDAAALKRGHPERRLVVLGCLSQRYADELKKEIPEIDALAGTEAHGSIVGLLEALTGEDRPAERSRPEGGRDSAATAGTDEAPRLLTTGPHTAYLKIAEGCDHRCAFCVIPSIRGPFRSRRPEAILREARQLIGMGVKELILVAQDATAYGRDLEPKSDLPSLLGRLDEGPGPAWIRLLYLHPGRVDPALVEAVARSRRVCRYFDLPMQHASDRVLWAMGRGETGAGLRRTIAMIRHHLPGAYLRGSFILGFPGETAEDVEELIDFLREVGLDHAGFFAFSPEEGTRAAEFSDQVDEEVKAARVKRVARVQKAIARAKNEARVGSTLEVLIDRRSGGAYPLVGRGEKDAPDIDGMIFLSRAERTVGGSGGPEPRPGDLVRARITAAAGAYDLHGAIIGVAE